MKYLFIGGPANGRRVELPEPQDCVKIVVMEEPTQFGLNPDPMLPNDCAHEYHRATLRTREERWTVYTHGYRWHISKIVPHLIEHHEHRTTCQNKT